MPPANPQSPQTSEEKKKHDDHYAESLAKMALLEYQMEEKAAPQTKHFISKKMLIYIVASLIISIISLVIGNIYFKKHNPNQTDEQTTQQLLDTKNELQDLQSSY